MKECAMHRVTISIFVAFSIAFLMTTSYAASSNKKVSKPIPCEEGYTCMRVKSGQSWKTLFPDETERGIVMRVNRWNGSLYAGKVIKIPNNLSGASLLDYSPFPRQITPPDEKLVVIDPKLLAFAAYDANGTLINWGPASAGRNWCPDIQKGCRTKAGEFRIYSLGSSNCKSRKFPIPRGGAPMPFCMFFNGGQALHGSPGEVLAGNHSHGCVRLFVPDAEWLRYDFVEPPGESNDYRGTKVVVMPY